MPRRKRRLRSLDGRKGPLMFTESPVNLIHDRQSPVLCSDHPPTASVIPIDDSMSLQWVSPQFSALPTVERRPRRCRHVSNENNRVTRSRRKTELDITDVHMKYPSLRFVGADTNGVSAMASDLSTMSLRPSKKRLGATSPSVTQKRPRCEEPKRTLFNDESNVTLFAETLHTPKRQTLSAQNKVLVYDTPEEDYALNVRQRRLKFLQRQCRVKSNS